MTAVTKELVDAIGTAFNNNNIDEVMGFFAVDATFDHAAGPDIHGKRFEGKDAIRAVLETIDCHLSGNKAVCEYRRVAKLKSGEEQDFLSVDILTFKNGLIVHKDTYYKSRS